MVIPDPGTGCSRVTHPSAAVLGPKPFPARLACVRHAASVRPEPGSNPQEKFDPAQSPSLVDQGGPAAKFYPGGQDQALFNFQRSLNYKF